MMKKKNPNWEIKYILILILKHPGLGGLGEVLPVSVVQVVIMFPPRNIKLNYLILCVHMNQILHVLCFEPLTLLHF